MSYILDALKKAEAERKLGSIPNVHTQALPGKTPGGNTASWQQRLPWLLACAMTLIVAALLIWIQPWQNHTQQRVVQAPAPMVAPTPAVPLVNIAPPPAPIAENITPPPQPLHHDTPATAAEKSETKTAKAVASKAPDLPPASTQKPAKKEQTAPEKTKVPPASVEVARVEKKSDTAHAEDNAVGTLQDLPANIQRELPPVVVNGYIYSKNPADSSVLINKKLLREGDQITPDLQLEKMMQKGAILNYKGYRYRISF